MCWSRDRYGISEIQNLARKLERNKSLVIRRRKGDDNIRRHIKNNNNQLMFVTETCYAFFVVQPEILNNIRRGSASNY